MMGLEKKFVSLPTCAVGIAHSSQCSLWHWLCNLDVLTIYSKSCLCHSRRNISSTTSLRSRSIPMFRFGPLSHVPFVLVLPFAAFSEVTGHFPPFSPQVRIKGPLSPFASTGMEQRVGPAGVGSRQQTRQPPRASGEEAARNPRNKCTYDCFVSPTIQITARVP